jgi:hypothetical protein
MEVKKILQKKAESLSLMDIEIMPTLTFQSQMACLLESMLLYQKGHHQRLLLLNPVLMILEKRSGVLFVCQLVLIL